MEPVAVAMLGAWASHWQKKKKKVPILCDDPPAKGVAYAKRMGLFNFIQAKGLPSLLSVSARRILRMFHRGSKRG